MGLKADAGTILKISGDAGGSDGDNGKSGTSGPDGLDLDLSGKDDTGGGDGSGSIGGDESDSGAAGAIGAAVQGGKFVFFFAERAAPLIFDPRGHHSSGASRKRPRKKNRGAVRLLRRSSGDKKSRKFAGLARLIS